MEQSTKWFSVWGNAVSVAGNRPEPVTIHRVTVFYDGVFHPAYLGGSRGVTIAAGKTAFPIMR